MKQAFVNLLRNRSFVVIVHVGLWVLLYLALRGMGGRMPEYRDARAATSAPQTVVPVSKLDQLFSQAALPAGGSLTNTNPAGPFFTKHFIPPTTPAPPPPTTKKIELTYQGFYDAAGQGKRAVIKMGEAFLICSPGSNVTANLFVAQATMQSLLLTNASAQTNLLLLNTKKEIEVPIK
jgi:hypothetical protein